MQKLMNITQEKTGDLTATLKVEITENDYAAHYDKELKSYRKQASIPGFRPGKVPMGIIQKKYGIAIMAEEVNKIVSNSINDYIKENNLNILGYPIPNTEKENQLDFATQKDFTFHFDFALTPEIKLDLSGNTVADYYNIKVEDEIINKYINDIRSRNGNFEDVETIEDTDKVDVQLNEVDDSSNIVEQGISNTAFDFLKKINDKELKQSFIGLKTGDTLVINLLKATANADETAKILGIENTLTDKIEANYRVTIEKISRLKLADLSVDLYKKAFPADEIVDETQFRERVAKEASRAYNEESDKIFVPQTMEKLINEADFDLPDEFMKKWLYVSNEGKLSIDQIERNFEHYKHSMKHQLFENKLITEHPELEIKDADVKNEIKKYFSFYIPENDDENSDERNHQLDLIAEKYMKNKEEIERIHEQLFNQRLLSLFKSNLTLNLIDVTYDELIEIMKSAHPHHHNHNHDHDHEHEHDHEHNSNE